MDGELLLEVLEVLAEVLVGLLQVVHRAACVKHSGVVLATAVQSDVGQRALRHFLREVHGDLTCLHNLTLAGLALEQFKRQIEVIANDFLDVVDGNFSFGVSNKFFNYSLS